MNEEFKPVVGYEGLYEVSNLGNVKAVTRIIVPVRGYKYEYFGGLLKHRSDTKGYSSISLRKDGVSKTHRVHRLIAIAFIENPENKRAVNHIDGDKTNNNLSNLQWVTHSENTKHAYDTGLINWNSRKDDSAARGEKHYKSVLTEQDVLYIRKHAKKNGGTMNNAVLGRKFGVTRKAVGCIVNGQAWKEVTA